MKILQPGLYAMLPMHAIDEDDDDSPLGWPSNFADEVNRNAAPVYTTEIPDGGLVLEPDVDGSGHSVMTPFGPLTSESSYAVIPVASDETNFLPNLQYAYNWIVLALDAPTAIGVEGSVVTVGDVSFDIEDAHSMDDCAGIQIPAPLHLLDDVAFSIVDEDFVEIASFTASDREYGAFTFMFEAPRLDYDLQHITIDDAQRAVLEDLGTPAAKALLACWGARAHPHVCLRLRKRDRPAPLPLAA